MKNIGGVTTKATAMLKNITPTTTAKHLILKTTKKKRTKRKNKRTKRTKKRTRTKKNPKTLTELSKACHSTSTSTAAQTTTTITIAMILILTQRKICHRDMTHRVEK